MLRGIDAAKAGMMSILEYNDNIAHSLANANTTAFKQTNLTFKNIHDAAVNAKTNRSYNLDNAGVIGALSQGSVVDSYTIDFSQGVIKDTGRKFDFAVNGDGFFKLKMADGSFVYTRNGVMQVQTDGTITDNDGNPLMNEKGTVKIPNKITVNEKEVPVDYEKILVKDNGDIYYENKLCSKINLYEFEDKTKLTDVGDGHFVSTDENANPAKLATKSQVKQGALEMSNANAITALINSMTAQRAYESMNNIMQTNSTTLQKAISSVGKVAE